MFFIILPHWHTTSYPGDIIFLNYRNVLLYFRYELMTCCWQFQPKDRPCFSMMVDNLRHMLNDDADEYIYLNIYKDAAYDDSQIPCNDERI